MYIIEYGRKFELKFSIILRLVWIFKNCVKIFLSKKEIFYILKNNMKIEWKKSF